jgi:hypothetical protein
MLTKCHASMLSQQLAWCMRPPTNAWHPIPSISSSHKSTRLPSWYKGIKTGATNRALTLTLSLNSHYKTSWRWGGRLIRMSCLPTWGKILVEPCKGGKFSVSILRCSWALHFQHLQNIWSLKYCNFLVSAWELGNQLLCIVHNSVVKIAGLQFCDTQKLGHSFLGSILIWLTWSGLRRIKSTG